MKKGYIAFAALCAAALASCTCPSAGEQRLRPSEYVSTLVGTQSDFSLSTGNTYPAIALPWGMNFWTPQTGKMGDGWAYTYGAHQVRGFKQTHQPSPWIDPGSDGLRGFVIEYPVDVRLRDIEHHVEGGIGHHIPAAGLLNIKDRAAEKQLPVLQKLHLVALIDVHFREKAVAVLVGHREYQLPGHLLAVAAPGDLFNDLGQLLSPGVQFIAHGITSFCPGLIRLGLLPIVPLLAS